ncbi:hypothetical protein WJX81_000991 [Elliptochloris bilobata]|uniref:PROP1-like PPR domain-containing protein n=1 Tax=Elliptochloris bilobata TaxID=381761 RepID=A0AAW1QDS4_9CHLO
MCSQRTQPLAWGVGLLRRGLREPTPPRKRSRRQPSRRRELQHWILEQLLTGGITGCIDAMRGHAATRTVEAYGIALSLVAREPRATWQWAADFGLGGMRSLAGGLMRDSLPANAFDLVYTAMREDGLSPNAWCIRQGLSSRARRSPRDALMLVAQMADAGAKVQYSHVQTLVDRFAEAGDPQGLLDVFTYARDWGISFEQIWVTQLVAAYGRAGRPEGARMAMLEAARAGMRTGTEHQLRASAVALGRAGFLDEAQERVDAFERARGRLTHETFQALLHLYAQAGMPEDAAAIMARIEAAGFVPKARDWSALLRAHAKLGDLEGAGAVCAAMAEAGVPADQGAYAALAHVYMLHSDTAAIHDMLPMVRSLGRIAPHSPAAAVWDLLARTHVYRGEVAEARAVLADAPPEILSDSRAYKKLALQLYMSGWEQDAAEVLGGMVAVGLAREEDVPRILDSFDVLLGRKRADGGEVAQPGERLFASAKEALEALERGWDEPAELDAYREHKAYE